MILRVLHSQTNVWQLRRHHSYPRNNCHHYQQRWNYYCPDRNLDRTDKTRTHLVEGVVLYKLAFLRNHHLGHRSRRKKVRGRRFYIADQPSQR
jgi:hypothetical protein